MSTETKMLGMNKDFQKKANRGLMLRLIATGNGITRTELAAKTGLTKTAISQIINELISKNYIIETGSVSKTELGRSPVMLAISPDGPDYIGIQVSRRFVEVVLCDMCANIKRKEAIYREWESADELLRAIYSICDRFVKEDSKVIGIGIACIGPVSLNEGRMLYPLRFHGIGNIPFKKLVEDRYNLPTYFDHDNQSAVLAEHLFGNAAEFQDVLLIGLGRGIGCGILVGGNRIHSFTGYAPEIGHVSIDHNGTKCICGNRGCLENYIRTDLILDQFKLATEMNYTYEEFCEMSDNTAVDTVMREVVRKLSLAVVSTLNILNSQVVILTLDCCAWDEKYIKLLETEINERKFGNKEVIIPVRKAKFLESAATLGAACNVIAHMFTGDLL